MDNTVAFSLLSLPDELLATILKTLAGHDLIRFREVSQLFHSLIDSHVELQYRIALFTAALQDGPPSSALPADRMKMLEAHQLAWEKFEWQLQMTVPEETRGIWELYGNVFAQGSKDDQRHLSFMQLPSKLRGIPQLNWNVEVDFVIRDFGMDPSQDLLVLMEAGRTLDAAGSLSRIHFRSLSSGGRHPLALVNPIEETDVEFLTGRWSYTIQLSGSHVGIMYDARGIEGPGETQLIVWNWVTGHKCLARKSNTVCSFAFISDRHIVIGLLHHGRTLAAFDPDGTYDVPSMDVVEFPDGYDETHLARHLYTLLYPTLAEGVFPYHFRIRSDPAPGWTPPAHQGVPFHVGQGERVFVLNIAFLTSTRVLSIVQFVPLATLAAFVAPSDGAPPPDAALPMMSSDEFVPTVRRIPWEDWGPAGSRMTADVYTDDTWVCHVFGTRFASAKRVRATIGEGLTASYTCVQLWDFNQRAFRRGAEGIRDRGEANESQEKYQPGYLYIHEPLEPDIDDIFAEPIVTSLPYRARMRLIPTRLHEHAPRTAVMLSEDTVILVDRAGAGTGVRNNQYLTF